MSRSLLSLLAAGIALLLLIGCTGDPTPAPESASAPESTGAPTAAPTAASTSTPASAPTTAPASEPTKTPVPTPTAIPDSEPASTPAAAPTATSTPRSEGPKASGQLFRIDDETLWQELYDQFNQAEQSCIRRALGGDFNEILGLGALDESPEAEEAGNIILGCLDAETARVLFISSLIQEIGQPVELAGPQAECLLGVAPDLDVASTFGDPPGEQAFEAYLLVMAGISQCVPNLLVSAMTGDDQFDMTSLSSQGADCLRVTVSQAPPEAIFQAMFAGPQFFLLLDGEDVSPETRRWARDMRACVPGLFDVVDDHGNSDEDATYIGIGEEIQGEVNYVHDLDHFVFEATGGEWYRFDIIDTQSTQTRRAVSAWLYDSIGDSITGEDFYSLWYGDHHSGHIWRASESGPVYVQLLGEIGPYSLAVTVLGDTLGDLAGSDHGDTREDATLLEVGVASVNKLAGSDEGQDIDYFVFEALEGEYYVINAPEAWDAWVDVVLSDAEGVILRERQGNNVVWQAPASGRYYLALEDFDTVYVLSVEARDPSGIPMFSIAMPIAVGEAVEAEFEFEEETEYFVFQGTEGTNYRIRPVPQMESFLLRLYGADGARLALEWPMSSIEDNSFYVVAPVSGPYYLEAIGFFGHGPYSIEVTVVQNGRG